jgi:hypothetical protein
MLTGNPARSPASNSKFNCSKTEKRPDKYIGFPVGWEKAGPLPLLFPTATASAFFGSLFGLTTQWNCRKKEKIRVKKWSNACIMEGVAEVNRI